MKIGIDSYSYHRFFGEVFPEQEAPDQTRTIDDLIAHAKRLEVQGLSLETCFMPALDEEFMAELRQKLDAAGLDRVLAWGHPMGLEVGRKPEAVADFRAHMPFASVLGATVMRLPCGNFRHRGTEPVKAQQDRLVPILKDLAAEARERGLKLGLENHGDFTAEELIEILSRVAAPNLGVTLDTCNNLRILEDPVAESIKLAPYAVATHIKDATATGIGSPRTWRTFFPSIGLGKGIIDIARILQTLKNNGYEGLLCIELDILPAGHHEDEELADSVAFLKRTLPTLT